MNMRTAASIVALRPALEALIVKATTSPEGLMEPEELDSELMAVIRALSRLNSSRFGVEEETDE